MLGRNSRHFDRQLLRCIENGKNAEAKFLIRNSADIHNQLDYSNATLLHFAAKFGNGGITRFLIEAGCNVDCQDIRGQSPLMLAVEEERVTTIRVLLDSNASIHVTDKNGRSALQMVVQGSLISQNTIQQFLHKLKEETSSDSRLLVQKLRAIGCPLRIAIFLNDPEAIRLMLEEDSRQIDDPDPEIGETALHVAVRQLSLENVRLLTTYGANLNVQNVEGNTPLYYLDVNSKNADRNLEILKILMDRGAVALTDVDGIKKSQICCILEYGSREAIHLLMQYDIDLCAVNMYGSTALHYLARNMHSGVFDELRNKNFDVNVRNNALYTPLHLISGNLSSLKFLVSNGADVNALRNGITPLIKILKEKSFSQKCLVEGIEILLQYGADPQYIRYDGTTIFDYAPNENSLVIVKPVVAYLALLQDSGKPISPLIFSKVNAHHWLKEYYDLCKQQLANMKKTVVWESITTYKLLVGSDKQLAFYMRNHELIDKLEPLDDFKFESCYHNFLHRRVERAIVTAELKRCAAIRFCEVTKMSYQKYHVFVDMIIQYLNDQDMRNFIRK